MTIPRTTTGRGFPRPSIPPPQVQARKKKKGPLCIQCERKAKLLPLYEGHKPAGKFFCSKSCAAEWALRFLPTSNHIWCVDCMMWTDQLGMCNCDRAAALAQVGEQIAAADGKAVQS